MNTQIVLSGEQRLESDAPLRIFQITDTHLMGHAGGCLLEMDTDASLAAVLTLARKHAASPDAVLVTGDIAGEASVGAYQRFIEHMGDLADVAFWLPGNHDDSLMPEAAGQFLRRSIVSDAWQIVMLNSQVPTQVGGHVNADELASLEQLIASANVHKRHLLVALHHHLLPVGCAWLDDQRIDNADRVRQILAGATQKVVVINGHVHQESDQTLDGIRYLSAPSTCVQFAPGQTRFKVDAKGPGFRVLELWPDGRIETQVIRLPDDQFSVDLSSGGYE